MSAVMDVTFSLDDQEPAHIRADRIALGVDGVDTWRWVWGLTIHGQYHEWETGHIQHREHEGAMTLLANIIQKIRYRKAD